MRLSNMLTITRRELSGYFSSPLAYVFIVIFLVLSGFMTFKLGNFFQVNDTNLALTFFAFHPWLFLVLVPAMAMRLWAEERKSGTMELLFTMPVSVSEAVLGKFLAAWCMLGISLLLTFPIIITVEWLGDPDYGAIISGYIGSFLMAGAYLAIGSFTSSTTRNQVISFVVAVVICLLLILAGHPSVSDFFTRLAPSWIPDLLTTTSVLSHFHTMTQGVIDLRDLVYFASIIFCGLFATGIVIQSQRSA